MRARVCVCVFFKRPSLKIIFVVSLTVFPIFAFVVVKLVFVTILLRRSRPAGFIVFV